MKTPESEITLLNKLSRTMIRLLKLWFYQQFSKSSTITLEKKKVGNLVAPSKSCCAIKYNNMMSLQLNRGLGKGQITIQTTKQKENTNYLDLVSSKAQQMQTQPMLCYALFKKKREKKYTKLPTLLPPSSLASLPMSL